MVSESDPVEPSPLPPRLDALLEFSDDSVPPKEGILALAEAMRADEALASRAIAEYRAEIDAADGNEGSFAVWLSFALALSGRDDAGEALLDVVVLDPEKNALLPTGLSLAAKCALIERGEWTLRRLVSFFPLDADGLKNQLHAFDLLHLARAAVSVDDEALRRAVAEEAARLLGIPGLPDDFVLGTCVALAASDPERALDLVPPCLSRCMESRWMEKVLREIRKRGSAERLLSSPWDLEAETAAEELLDDLETADGEGGDASALQDELDAAKPVIEEFLASEHRRGIPDGDDGISADLEILLRNLLAHHAPNLLSTKSGDVADFMTGTLPRNLTAEPEDFRRLAVLLRAFFSHLADTGEFPFAAECAEEAETRAEEMVRQAGARIGDSEDDGLEPDPRVPPTVREEHPAEPGPYDPCPCGSGQKFKFCCRKKA